MRARPRSSGSSVCARPAAAPGASGRAGRSKRRALGDVPEATRPRWYPVIDAALHELPRVPQLLPVRRVCAGRVGVDPCPTTRPLPRRLPGVQPHLPGGGDPLPGAQESFDCGRPDRAAGRAEAGPVAIAGRRVGRGAGGHGAGASAAGARRLGRVSRAPWTTGIPTRGLSRFSRRERHCRANKRFRRENGTVPLAAPKGTGPCFRPTIGLPTRRHLAEKWTSPRRHQPITMFDSITLRAAPDRCRSAACTGGLRAACRRRPWPGSRGRSSRGRCCR